MPTRLVAPAQHRRMPWRNGGGTTSEIAMAPAEGPLGFLWRVSLAEVTQDGPFSPFPGCHRTLMLVKGAGMVLDFADRPDGPRSITLDRRFAPVDFSGDWQTHCRLIAGPVRDLNVIADHQRMLIDWRVLPLDAATAALEPAPVWIVHLPAGAAMLEADRHLAMAEGDTAIIEDGGAVPHLRTASAGTVAFAVALRPRRSRRSEHRQA